MNRRKFMTVAGIGTVAVGGLTYYIHDRNQTDKYGRTVANVWKHTDDMSLSDEAAMLELVRYATLAANSHNTQPWFFKIRNRSISISPDFRRRCAVVDPDDHHLYASLGCAAENIVHAAKAFGLHAVVSVNDTADDVIRIDFEPIPREQSELFQAIPKRQCTKAPYNGKKMFSKEMKILEASAQDVGISTQLFSAKNDMEAILEYVVEGNSAQMQDAAFVQELKDWIRFNPSEAIKYGDGLFAAVSDNPTTPSWLGNLIFSMAFTEEAENDKYKKQIRSSAGVIAFISEKNDIEHWIKAGRSYQRFALQATAIGLKHAFINQPVEVPKVREQLAQFLNIGERRTDLIIRFGYGPDMPRALRRPVEQVLV